MHESGVATADLSFFSIRLLFSHKPTHGVSKVPILISSEDKLPNLSIPTFLRVVSIVNKRTRAGALLLFSL